MQPLYKGVSPFMKKFIIVSLILLLIIAVFVGCLRKKPQSAASETPQPESQAQPETSITEPVEPSEPPASAPDESETPEETAKVLLDSLSNLDKGKVDELIGQYFGGQSIPEEYLDLLGPISERVTYKIGDTRIDGDKAEVDIAVTSVDAQSAINSIMPAAVTHLAVMQLTGKDVSNPEKILAEYASENIKWDSIQNIKTDCTLYLVTGADGEWKVDATNPENIGFANAISGGAVEVAKNLKSFADKYK